MRDYHNYGINLNALQLEWIHVLNSITTYDIMDHYKYYLCRHCELQGHTSGGKLGCVYGSCIVKCIKCNYPIKLYSNCSDVQYYYCWYHANLFVTKKYKDDKYSYSHYEYTCWECRGDDKDFINKLIDYEVENKLNVHY